MICICISCQAVLYQANNRSKVWSAAEGKSLDVSLDSAFKYYCIYKGVERPDASKLQTLKTFKTAI